MRKRIPRVLPLAAAAATACVANVGQRIERYPIATEPRGLIATLTVEGRAAIVGELLAVQDTAFLLMGAREVMVVPYRKLRHASFEQMRSYATGARPPAPEVRRELRLRSRYPQGVSPEVLAKLLALNGQSSPTVVDR